WPGETAQGVGRGISVCGKRGPESDRQGGGARAARRAQGPVRGGESAGDQGTGSHRNGCGGGAAGSHPSARRGRFVRALGGSEGGRQGGAALCRGGGSPDGGAGQQGRHPATTRRRGAGRDRLQGESCRAASAEAPQGQERGSQGGCRRGAAAYRSG